MCVVDLNEARNGSDTQLEQAVGSIIASSVMVAFGTFLPEGSRRLIAGQLKVGHLIAPFPVAARGVDLSLNSCDCFALTVSKEFDPKPR